MNKHSSHKCDHKIDMCLPCDTVFCSKCEKEWSDRACTRNHYSGWYNGSGWTTNTGLSLTNNLASTGVSADHTHCESSDSIQA